MKVLVVTNLYPTEKKPTWGTFVREQVESLRAAYPDELDIDVYLVDGSQSKTSYLKALFELPRFVRQGKYDLVHAHYGLTLVSLLLVRVPIVVTFHGSDLLKQPVATLSKLLAVKASRIITVSGNLRAVLGKGDIIPCGIPSEGFLLPPDWQPPGRNGMIRVLFPANPSVPVKNYPLFRAVCSHLSLFGYSVCEVHLNGVPRDAVPKAFWNADLMILTSHSEGSPTVIKEAIAARLPFVSVDVGDVREWVGLIDFGMVTKSRDPSEIAHCARELLLKVSDRRMCDISRALESLDTRATARRVMDVYREIIRAT